MRLFIGLLVLFVSPAAIADDFTALTDAAYCSGAISKNIELTRRDFGNSVPVQGDQQNSDRLDAIIDGAIKQHKIDDQMVGKLMVVGAKDAALCWDNSKRCMLENFERTEKNGYDVEQSKHMHENCLLAQDNVCKRVVGCN